MDEPEPNEYPYPTCWIKAAVPFQQNPAPQGMHLSHF